MARIQLVATDGNAAIRVLWIEQRPNGIYAGWNIEGNDFHSTYHTDGNRFMTVAWQTQSMDKGPRLDDFKGMVQISDFAFNCDLSRLDYHPPYKLECYDHVLYVDTRAFNNYVGCSAFIVEPKNFEIIHSIHSIGSETHIYNGFTPWIVFTVR